MIEVAKSIVEKPTTQIIADIGLHCTTILYGDGCVLRTGYFDSELIGKIYNKKYPKSGSLESFIYSHDIIEWYPVLKECYYTLLGELATKLVMINSDIPLPLMMELSAMLMNDNGWDMDTINAFTQTYAKNDYFVWGVLVPPTNNMLYLTPYLNTAKERRITLTTLPMYLYGYIGLDESVHKSEVNKFLY